MEKFIIRKLGRRIVRKETILLIYHKKSLYSSGYGDFFVNSQQITREMKHFISILFAFLLLVGCCGEKQEKSMSITVNLRYTGTDGNARKFAEEMVSSGTVDAIRAEEGNLRYEYYQSLDDPETILLIDSWANQEAIDKHHATPMMDTIVRLREKYDLHMTVERYSAIEMSETENQFIRR